MFDLVALKFDFDPYIDISSGSSWITCNPKTSAEIENDKGISISIISHVKISKKFPPVNRVKSNQISCSEWGGITPLVGSKEAVILSGIHFSCHMN